MSLASNAVLRDRGQMFSAVRAFFHERGVLEVDCPLLSHYAPVDAHIDIFEVSLEGEKKGYLHSSPEYGMKRLLARGLGPIYQISHVYRKGETGAKHTPEFTLIEWYRIGCSFDEFLKEVIELLSLFLGKLPVSKLTYQQAFETYLEIDYETAPSHLLQKKAKEQGIFIETNDKEELLDLLWGCSIEPHFGSDRLTVITDFPASQAMLAQTREINGKEVAERFEIAFNQMELGNGYHELTDWKEQIQRLHKANKKREALNKKALPIDPHFLEALQSGLPDSYGIAVGFDRLMMLRHEVSNIASILPFSWETS